MTSPLTEARIEELSRQLLKFLDWTGGNDDHNGAIVAAALRTAAREAAAAENEACDYRIFKDGNAWCAVGKGFINLQESKAGFGHTPLVALGELIVAEGEP